MIAHSLGGFLGLKLSLKAPDRFAHVVIVDSLPFLGGARNPAATAETVKPMADGMRAGMLAADEATYKAQLRGGLVSLSNNKDRIPTLASWGEASDRNTTTQAIRRLPDQVARRQRDRGLPAPGPGIARKAVALMRFWFADGALLCQ